MQNKPKTSWGKVCDWYDKIVDDKGHYYHKEVIFPNLKKLFPKKTFSLLDIGCGQAPLSRIAHSSNYLGIDLSKELIELAQTRNKKANMRFSVQDATKPFDLKQTFDCASCILAMQNMHELNQVFINAYNHLKTNGQFFIVLNHPCFRIPRQSSWAIDKQKKMQYRRIDSYMSKMKIPINMHPGKNNPAYTYSFHYSLTDIIKPAVSAGFTICKMQEWCSNKQSLGKMAKMENRARKQFPLFLCIVAKR